MLGQSPVFCARHGFFLERGGTHGLGPRFGFMWTHSLPFTLPFGALLGLSSVAFLVGLILH